MNLICLFNYLPPPEKPPPKPPALKFWDEAAALAAEIISIKLELI